MFDVTALTENMKTYLHVSHEQNMFIQTMVAQMLYISIRINHQHFIGQKWHMHVLMTKPSMFERQNDHTS